MRRRNREAGFTLIELLVVTAIIAILAAIAIANYLNALQRTRQKRTMADMRTIAQAWELRASETRTYSAAGFSFPTGTATYDSVRALLVPQYIQKMPTYDAWGQPFEFGVEGRVYAIRSPGRDGIYEGDEYTSVLPTVDPDCDIVFSNGNFVQFPDTRQSE